MGDERSITCRNLNLYMINSIDGFVIIEHREPPTSSATSFLCKKLIGFNHLLGIVKNVK